MGIVDFLSKLSTTEIWIILAIIFGILEAFTLGITSIWFVFGAIASSIFSYLGFSIGIQIISFIVVSVVLLIFTRPILIDKMKLGREKTNVDSIVGKIALVEEDINNVLGKGRVIIGGQSWSARSENGQIILKNEEVVVNRVEGVKVIVSNLE